MSSETRISRVRMRLVALLEAIPQPHQGLMIAALDEVCAAAAAEVQSAFHDGYAFARAAEKADELRALFDKDGAT